MTAWYEHHRPLGALAPRVRLTREVIEHLEDALNVSASSAGASMSAGDLERWRQRTLELLGAAPAPAERPASEVVKMARGVLFETLHGPVPGATVAALAQEVLRLAAAERPTGIAPVDRDPLSLLRDGAAAELPTTMSPLLAVLATAREQHTKGDPDGVVDDMLRWACEHVAAAERPQDAQRSTEPRCPLCKGALRRVRQDSGSMLNAEQFDAGRAGDWYCEACPPHPDRKSRANVRYWWDRELRGDAPRSEPAAGGDEP